MDKTEFKPIDLELIPDINKAVLQPVLTNSTHRLLSIDDKNNYYFIFSVFGEDTELKEYTDQSSGKPYTVKELADKVRDNLGKQFELAKDSGNTELMEKIPYLGFEKVQVIVDGTPAILMNARLISTNNGWTFVGQLAYTTSRSNASMKPITMRRSKKKNDTEAPSANEQKEKAKSIGI